MVSSDFFNRVAAYPMVSSAYQQATGCVAWAKDRSAYARSAAGLAESGLRRVAGSAEPLLSRYEERITGLDRMACRQLLDRLETACPAVLQPTEEVAERGRGYYRESVKPKVDFVLSPVSVAVAKAQAAKMASLDRYRQLVASRHGQAGLRQFDQLIQLLSDCIDKCLPPGEAAKQANNDGKEGTEKQEKKSAENGDDDDEEEDESTEAEDTPADPVQSLFLAYSLGRKVSERVSNRVVDQAGDLAATAHRLVERLTGRSMSAKSDSAATASSDASASASDSNSKSASRTSSGASNQEPPANQEKPPTTDADADAEADESLNRSDMSTD